MKFLNTKTVIVVLFSVFVGFFLGQNYDIAKNYFNFEFLKATISPSPASFFEEPELNFSEIEFENLVSEEEIASEQEEVEGMGQAGQMVQSEQTSLLSLTAIQEIIDDIKEQIDVISQEISRLQGETQEFLESESGELIIEEELKEEGQKEEKQDICPIGININTASKEELEKIIGVGLVIAQKIIEARPFSSIYDLTKVAGIGEIILQKIINQGCVYVEGDTGRPASGGGGGGSGGVSSTPTSTPTPIINPSFLPDSPVNKDIEVSLSTSSLRPATYDLKISILEISGQSEQKRTLSEIYDGEKWQSSYNYLLRIFSGTSFEDNFKLRIKQDKQDFRGEADIIVKIRDSEKQKIQAQWQGKINIIDPEEEPEPLTDLTPPQIVFNLEPLQTSLFFLIYFEITNPVDTVTSSGLDGFVFQWKEEDGEWREDSYQQIEDYLTFYSGQKEFTGEDEKTYYFQIKAKDKAGNESDWVGTSTKISLAKNLLKNEFFEEWEGDGKPKDWVWDGAESRINQSSDGLVGDVSVELTLTTSSYKGFYQYGKTMTSDTTYYTEIWVKGMGVAKLGIKYPGSTYVYYGGDEIVINSDEWIPISLFRQPVNSGDDGGIKLNVKYDETQGIVLGSKLIIGAAWLGAAEPPANWPR